MKTAQTLKACLLEADMEFLAESLTLALQVLIPVPSAADSWVKRPNQAPLFNGRSALDVMLSGNVSDLFLVRQYVDAQRSGWA